MECITVDAYSNEEIFPRLVQAVRNSLQENYQFSVPNECIGFVVRCLRIKDNDVEKAAKLVKNFAKAIHQLHDMLDKFQPKFYKDLYFNGQMTVLKSRDSLGRQVIVFRVGQWDVKSFDFEEVAAAGMLLFSYIIGQSAETQRKGIIFINDLRGFGLQHVRAISPGRLTQLVRMMQDGSPGRIKGVHMIFHPKLFGLIYRIVKPFLKEKLAKRIHFHGDDVGSLHKHLSPEILPLSLGGTKVDAECMDIQLLHMLIREETIHKELMVYNLPSL